jgi:Ran GTPase-activating protein (RanGAP) involved in mRNA processing and transport
MISTFTNKFLDKCQDLNLDPPSSLRDLMKNPANSKTDALNLSGHTVSAKLCAAIANAIKDDDTYKELIIGDGFLGDDGAIHIANGVKTNTTLTKLDLRGNNIRSDGATAISQMLKINHTLKRLSLEWNCLGIWETGVRTIADALTTNACLEELDLRNNKIGPQGMQSLAVSLKHNTKLRRLDLRWNNAGIIGGRAFVDMLKWNTTIIEIGKITITISNYPRSPWKRSPRRHLQKHRNISRTKS